MMGESHHMLSETFFKSINANTTLLWHLFHQNTCTVLSDNALLLDMFLLVMKVVWLGDKSSGTTFVDEVYTVDGPELCHL